MTGGPLSATGAEGRTIRVLLVEDDEDDYVLTRDLLSAIDGTRFDLHWVQDLAGALRAVEEAAHDVVLLDYRLGRHTALDFLARMPADFSTPVILLTGQGEHAADVAAMEAGAADYLVKSELTPALLERALRYAVRHLHLQEVLRLRNRAIDAVEEGILITDARQADHPIIYANPGFERMTGYPARGVIGSNCRFLQGEDTDPQRLAEIRAAIAAGHAITADLLNYRSDGTPFWNRLSIGPIRDASGTLTHFVGVQQDISERKRAEAEREDLLQQLRAERSRLGFVIQQAPAFMAVARGPDHVFEMANDAYLRLVGARDLLGRTVREALPELVEQGIVEILDRVYRSGEPFVASGLSVTLRRGSDETLEERILDIVYQPLHEPDGSIGGILAHGVDVTQAVQGHERLRAAEAHYRRLVTTAPQTIYALDLDGRFTELNPAAERLFERPVSQVLGKHLSSVVAAGDLPRAAEMMRRALVGHVEYDGEELRITRPSGEERLVRVTSAAIRVGDAVTGVHGNVFDITEARRGEERIRLLATALDTLEQGVSVLDEDWKYVYANEAHARLLGYDPAELARLGAEAFFPDEETAVQMRQAVDRVREEGEWVGSTSRRRLSDGQVIPVDLIIGRVEDGSRMMFFSILGDASERIAAEQQMRRVERLASVGTTLGGVAHELNNPLNAILNFTELLLMESRPGDEREDLEAIRRETNRMAKIVSDLRLVARQTQEHSERAEVDLNEVVLHVLKVREYSLRTSNIMVRTDLAATLPLIWADRGQMEQVVLNLVVNAEQAMMELRGEGMLILRTRASSGGATLHVVDDGPGISPAHLERVFDPFFTTKPLQEGTGLGLSLVHSIVMDHGGSVQVDSELLRGAAFRVDLPRAAASDPAAPPQEGEPVPERTPESLRVLVVDDEAPIRRAIVRYLTRLGHVADEAADGAAALRSLEDIEYDVIVSDVRMPGVGGRLLLERLREQGGGLEERLIFMTGEVGAETMAILARTQVPVLEKPFALAEVAAAVAARAAARR